MIDMTKYDDCLALIENEHSYVESEKKKFKDKAKEWIPRLRDALKEEEISNADIKDRILKDCLQHWTRETIMNNLGEEFKDEQKIKAGKKRAEIAITNEGNPENNNDENEIDARINSKIRAENEPFGETTEHDGENLITTNVYEVHNNAELLLIKDREIDMLKDRVKTLNEKLVESEESRQKIAIESISKNPESFQHKKEFDDEKTKIHFREVEVRDQIFVFKIRYRGNYIPEIELDESKSKRLNR